MDPDIELFDVVVIGGGINGVGIAADAAGRGLSVLLCEQNDLASATSSSSSKLIHGGLRYLEHYEFKLVRQSLAEREVLLRNAPHIMRPLRFRLPHQPHLRPHWQIRAGLFLYDHLAKRVSLPASKSIVFSDKSPLKSHITRGFEYFDGWVDDSRLVVLNAMAAHQSGAKIQTQTECVEATRRGQCRHISLLDHRTGKHQNIKARALINATGPWVDKLFGTQFQLSSPQKIRLVKGSHIVVKKIHDGDEAYILQNEDGRIVFVLPFEDDFSLIGTTDVEFNDEPGVAQIDQQEIDYLIKITNQYFDQTISQENVVSTFSGARPLLEDESSSAQTVTRDYRLTLNDVDKAAPLLSVFGGKITTYRKLAEKAVDKLAIYFPSLGRCKTRHTRLPGGNFENKFSLNEELKIKYPWINPIQLDRYVRSYGTLTYTFLMEVTCEKDLGYHFGHGLYEKEVQYLVRHEWVTCVEDLTLRRTKLGLRLSKSELENLSNYLKECTAAKAA